MGQGRPTVAPPGDVGAYQPPPGNFGAYPPQGPPTRVDPYGIVRQRERTIRPRRNLASSPMYVAPRPAYSADPMYVAPATKSVPHVPTKPPPPSRPLVPEYVFNEQVVPERP
eukprot:14125716-Heterocapsa_arctica.AAC.1